MRSKAQEEEITKKILKLSIIFVEENLSDKELSKQTGIPTSSVGRYLTCKLAKEVLGEKTFAYIKQKRQENKLKGRSKGGQTFAKNNHYIKDEFGKFIGSYKDE
ncbi:MAG: hypothetical protein GX951_01045 [Mollicutes bacterium]|nr:hypothetical protein [Mollicutes bacterium]